MRNRSVINRIPGNTATLADFWEPTLALGLTHIFRPQGGMIIAQHFSAGAGGTDNTPASRRD